MAKLTHDELMALTREVLITEATDADGNIIAELHIYPDNMNETQIKYLEYMFNKSIDAVDIFKDAK